jgi:hypothetical protein
MIHFNIILPPASTSSFWLSNQNPMSILLLPHAPYMPCPSHAPWLHNSNYTWRRVQVIKLFIVQFSPTSCHFIPLRSKYSPQHPQSMFLR